MVKNPFKRLLGRKDYMKNALIADMMQYLLGLGFPPEDAFKLSKEFWDKNINKIKKLESVLG